MDSIINGGFIFALSLGLQLLYKFDNLNDNNNKEYTQQLVITMSLNAILTTALYFRFN